MLLPNGKRVFIAVLTVLAIIMASTFWSGGDLIYATEVSVDVRAFGAVGDGVTDDTAAIQTAINSLTTGQRLIIPAGSYKITHIIFNPPDYCSLICNGTLYSS